MSKRKRAEIVQEIAEDIKRCAGGADSLAMTDPAILAAYEIERQHREAIRVAERAVQEQEKLAEQAELARQERQAEQVRVAEQARAAHAERQRQQQVASERRQLTALRQEWTQFKGAVTQAQIAQQREAYFNDLQRTVDDLNRVFNPPPQPEPTIIYVEKEPETVWGQLPTLPTWR